VQRLISEAAIQMVAQLGSEKGRIITDGSTFLRRILAGKSTELTKWHTDPEAINLDST